ncbi:interleukin 17-like protein [Ylistrum balloti]|uniref:interleukin 17-like protein n=1 Tax=Ylistrum balloti TaxID=509963 RepID=UPI002905BD32|nr:interleukin 17-like protein [Ylistrum balloti]
MTLLDRQVVQATWCRNPNATQMINLTHTLLQGSSLWLSHEATDIDASSVYRSLLQGDTSCPVPTGNGELEDPSTCPSYLVKEVDATRIPSTIVHAQCRCDSCQISGLRHKRRQQYACEPVYRFLPVLKRQNTCINGEYEYVLSQQKVAVACHCVRSRTNRPQISANHKSPENFVW